MANMWVVGLRRLLRLEGRGQSAPDRAASSMVATRAGLGSSVVIRAGDAAAMTCGGS
jgi:hypothetical protein